MLRGAVYSGVQRRGGGLEEAGGAAWGWHAMMGAVNTRGGGVEAALGRCHSGVGAQGVQLRGGGAGVARGRRRGCVGAAYSGVEAAMLRMGGVEEAWVQRGDGVGEALRRRVGASER